MTIVGSTGAMEHRCLVAGEDLVLACELSRPDATVRWLRDGQEVQAGERIQMEAHGVRRQLTIHGVQSGDSGCYICDAASDRMVTSVEVSGEPAGAQRPGHPQHSGIMLQSWARGGDASVTLLTAEAGAAAWQGRVGALSPISQELLVRKGHVRVVVRCIPPVSPSQGLVKFSLGQLPGAAPPASAAKG